MEIEWQRVLERLKEKRGVAILLGSTDSGKSTLARYLLENLLSDSFRVSLIDSDVGQSILGLPGTVSMKTFDSKDDLKDFMFEKMSFIGTVNPSTKIGILIEETKRMVDLCRVKSDISIVDTTGLVSGEIGKCLKIGKIRALRPDLIIAIERYDELENILEPLNNYEIFRLNASKMAKVRSREYRIRYRKKKYDDYFKGSEELFISNIRFFYNNREIDIKKIQVKEGTVVGLNHYQETLALGYVTEVLDNTLVVKTPLKNLKKINRVILGDILYG
jgi:polynucleotide 5'-hydroxyl-kinase GRC3/NOL9